MVSVPNFKLPRQEQHDRIFLQDAIDRYKNRLLTAAGYIYTIIKIYRQAGHRLNIPSPRSFYEYFQIPKSTFYRALIQLENTPGIQFQWEPIGGISMWWGGEEPPAAAVEPPAAAEPKYQRLNQLPADTKEKFEAFVRSQWRKLKGQEIRSFHRFVEKPGDFQDWWQKFRACPPPQAQKPAPITEVEPVIASKFATDADRPSPEQWRALRQLLASKKNTQMNDLPINVT